MIIHNSLDKTYFNSIVALMDTRTIITHKYSVINGDIYLFEIITKLVVAEQKCAAVDAVLIFGLFIV